MLAKAIPPDVAQEPEKLGTVPRQAFAAMTRPLFTSRAAKSVVVR
jgi:hypothetical protein